MRGQLFNQLHPEWQKVLKFHEDLILRIEEVVRGQEIAPDFDKIFRSLSKPISYSKVVIFGQDPYPTPGNADGLAFSVSNPTVPASLKNIFKELQSDIGGNLRTNPDLSDWFEQGVLLINRVLTTKRGSSLSHIDLGWQSVTDSVAQELGRRGVVAILWGKPAQELAGYFEDHLVMSSPHPSPLSAYKGFFGSSPFSRANAILAMNDLEPIHWQEKSPR